MATLPYFRDAGRSSLTPEMLKLLEPLFDSTQRGSGDSMEFIPNTSPWAYAQQSPDMQSLALYDPQGNYLGDDARNHESGDKNLLRFLATAAAMYGGAQLMGGEAGALGGGGEGLAGAEGMGLGGGGIEAGAAAGGGASSSVQPLTMFDMGINAVPGVPAMTGGLEMSLANLGISQIPQVGGMEALAGTAAKSAIENYSNEGRNYPTTQSTQGSGGSPWNAAVNAASGLPWKNILGAAAGLAGSRDSEQTASRDPWSAAQPLIRGLLDQGAELSKRYTENPFSDQQKTAYNNLGGLLNVIAQNTGGLLGGFGAAASGANNFDRSNQRRQLQGGQQVDLSGYVPGLLNFFPQGGR